MGEHCAASFRPVQDVVGHARWEADCPPPAGASLSPEDESVGYLVELATLERDDGHVPPAGKGHL